MFYIVKEWDNRREIKQNRLPTVNRRTWTRRIRQFEGDGLIKLKLEDQTEYLELLATVIDAHKIWERFKAGESIVDSVSILGRQVPPALQSKRAANQ